MSTETKIEKLIKDASTDGRVLDKIDITLVREVLREAELRLNNQQTSAHAQDLRATTTASFLMALAIGSAVAASASSMTLYTEYLFLTISLIAFVGAYGCMDAALSKPILTSGNEPNEWATLDELQKREIIALLEQCDYYQKAIEHNNILMKANGNKFNLSIRLVFRLTNCSFLIWVLAWGWTLV